MEGLGFLSVEIQPGVEQRVVDINSRGGVALVFHDTARVGLHEVQRIRGAIVDLCESLVYASAGFTPAAQEFAEKRSVALFSYSPAGVVKAESTSSRRLVELGWITTSPELETEARKELRDAIENYVQAANDVVSELGPAVDANLESLVEWDEVDDEVRARAQVTARDSEVLTALLRDLNGESNRTPAEFIHAAQCIEALAHKIAEEWGVDYSDIEVDAMLKRAVAK